MIAMARVMVIAGSSSIAQCLVNRLSKSPVVEACQLAPRFNGSFTLLSAQQAINTVVYAPQLQSQHRMIPNLTEAAAVFAECARMGMARVVVLSSAAIYGATPHTPGLITETRSPSRRRENPIGNYWVKLEALAKAHLGQHTGEQLTILRSAAILAHGDTHYFSRLFHRRFAITLPLHEPSLQWLSPEDLASAVCSAVERSNGGIFNVAP